MIQYKRVRDVKQPTRGNAHKDEMFGLVDRSAGIDFYVPNNDIVSEFRTKLEWSNPASVEFHDYDNDYFLLKGHSHVMIPSGITCNLQDHDGFLYSDELALALIAFNKSGVASKRQLDVAATVIDEDFQGELHISLTNTSPDSQLIFYGEKIVQFVLVPVMLTEWQEVKNDENLFKSTSSRGQGSFGSTGQF